MGALSKQRSQKEHCQTPAWQTWCARGIWDQHQIACNCFDGLQGLTFVALRLTLTHAQKERLLGQPLSSRRLSGGAASSGKALSLLSAAPLTMRKLLDSSFICAQQFQGYVFDTDGEEVRTITGQSPETQIITLLWICVQ